MCAVRVTKIRMAGVGAVKARARAEGRADPNADMELVRKAYLLGYKEAGRQCGWSESHAKNMARRYSGYADAILRERERRKGE